MWIPLFVVVCLCLLQWSVAELTLDSFHSTVLQSDRVWVVKFYSAMCGSCQEFAPTWDKLKGSVDSVEFTEISIDKQDGMKLAERYGALSEGIPNVKIFSRQSSPESKTIFNGEGAPTVPKLVKQIKTAIKG